MQDLLTHNPIIPVITLHREEDAVPLAQCLISAGFKTIEITLRTDCAPTGIELIHKQFPDLIIGAGTICNTRQISQAEALGCDFMVSPGITPDLLKCAIQSPLPLLPGISSASEIMLGLQLGYKTFKFFPAESLGGIRTLKALSGPFREVRFCATGGITVNNMGDYLNLPNVLSIGGSWMVNPSLIKQQKWSDIEQLLKTALATASSLMNHQPTRAY